MTAVESEEKLFSFVIKKRLLFCYGIIEYLLIDRYCSLKEITHQQLLTFVLKQ